MTTEDKAAGSSLRAAAKKKRPYRSQLTVLYIIAVIACVILGYIVGRRLLPGNEEQLAKSTLAGAGSGQTAGDSPASGPLGAGATGQDSEDLLPPLTTPGDSPEVAGAGIDDTAGAAGSAGAVTPSTSPAGGEVPPVSLPVLGASGADVPTAPRSGADAGVSSPAGKSSQLQTRPQLQPQRRSAPSPSAASPGGSGSSASAPVKSGAKTGERAASVPAQTGAVAPPPSPAPGGTATGDGFYRVIVGRRASLAEAKALEAQAKQAGLEVWVSGSGPYQVQVGAFRNRANAVAYAEELQSRGFPEATVIEPAP